VARALLVMSGMTKIAFTVDKKSGHIHAMLVPADRSEETRLSVPNGVAIAFLLFCIAGLIYLLTH
jgi:hypothetical protein